MNGHVLALDIQGPVPEKPEDPTGSGTEHGEAERVPSYRVAAHILQGKASRISVVGHVETVLPLDMYRSENGTNPFMETLLDALAPDLDMESCSRAVVSVPAGHVFWRSAVFPFKSRKRISQVLPMEMISRVPLAEDDYSGDAVFTGHEVRGQYIFLTASFSRQTLEASVAALDQRNITLNFFGPGAYLPACLLAQREGIDETHALVVPEAATVTVGVMHGGHVTGIRTFQRPGDNAELVQEIKRTLLVFMGELDLEEMPSFCHLVDSAGEATGLSDWMEDALGLSVRTVAVKALLSMESGNIPERGSSGLNALCAMEVISRRIPCLNLCNSLSPPAAPWEKYVPQLVTAAALLLICGGLWLGGLIIEVRALEDRIARIDRQAAAVLQNTFPEITTIVDPYMQMTVAVRDLMKQGAAGAGGAGEDQHGMPMTALLSSLSDGIPDDIDVEMTRLVWNDHRVVLSGHTDNYNSVDRIKGAIEAVGVFSDVKISSAAADKKDNRIRFKFTFVTPIPSEAS